MHTLQLSDVKTQGHLQGSCNRKAMREESNNTKAEVCVI